MAANIGDHTLHIKKHLAKIAKIIKEKRPADSWTMNHFSNPARADEFKLRHWTKTTELGIKYPFAKFAKSLDVVHYSDDEYLNVVAGLDKSWSKQDTDLLFALCDQFQLKFVVVADRLNFLREKREEKSNLQIQNPRGLNKRRAKLIRKQEAPKLASRSIEQCK